MHPEIRDKFALLLKYQSYMIIESEVSELLSHLIILIIVMTHEARGHHSATSLQIRTSVLQLGMVRSTRSFTNDIKSAWLLTPSEFTRELLLTYLYIKPATLTTQSDVLT